jgi:hypothetical protein
MKRSLHIGINDYPGTDSDLVGCVNDAQDWRGALALRGFDDQTEILNNAAMKKVILTFLKDIVAKTGPGDIAVITFSGHGTWVPDKDGDEANGRDEALCPWDFAKGEIITDDELYVVFSKCNPAARLVFISDSCHSGSVTRAAVTMPGVKEDGWNFQKTRFLSPVIALPDNMHPVARRVSKTPVKSKTRDSALLLAGCRDHEYSYDAWFNERPNGALTYTAIQALQTLAAGATYLDWYKAIRKHLPHTQYPQTPQLYGSDNQKTWKVLEA